jgi:hypothetical protein
MLLGRYWRGKRRLFSFAQTAHPSQVIRLILYPLPGLRQPGHVRSSARKGPSRPRRVQADHPDCRRVRHGEALLEGHFPEHSQLCRKDPWSV